MLDARAICDTCGHTRDWHDRDAMRARLRSDPPIERPCYREVGGAPCRCGGFRESGTYAAPAGSRGAVGPAPRSRLLQNAILTLLLIVFGLALLYAYRAETPAVPEVDVTRAIQDINAGQVRAVTISGSRATLEFRDSPSHKEQTTIPQPDTILARAIADYNAAHPSQQVELRVEGEVQTGGVTSILLSLLPFLLFGSFLYYAWRSRRRA